MPKTKPETTPTNDFWNQYDSEEYKPEFEVIPWMQILNKEDPTKAGFFLSADNAQAVNFSPNESWTISSATFRNGETADGFVCASPRLLIVRRSPLLVFNRDDGAYIGTFDRSTYDAGTQMVKVRYLLFIVGEDDELLHDYPLQLTTKGIFSQSFGAAYDKFKQDFDRAINKRYGQRFHCQCIFNPTVEPELRGDKEKSWVCIVQGYVAPTTETARSLFVGDKPEIKQKLESAFDEYKDFWKKGADTESDDNYETSTVWQIFCQKLNEAQTEDELDAMVNWLQVARQWDQVKHLPDIKREFNAKVLEVRARLDTEWTTVDASSTPVAVADVSEIGANQYSDIPF